MTDSDIDSKAHANHCPIFNGMTLDERGQVLERLEHLCFSEGETILREGKSTQYLWIIVRGRCQVVKATNTGDRELAVLESCAIFGEMSFFNPAPHSASVRAVTNVEIMRLSRESYDELEKTGSTAAARIAVNTVKVLAERLQQMDEFTGRLVDQLDISGHKKEWWDFRSKLYSEWEF